MSFDVVCKATDDRERWLAERLKGLTASVAPQLLGVHKYGSLLGTYLHYRNPEPPTESTPDQAWGQDRQLAVIANMGRRLGLIAEQSEELVRSIDHPWMLATLDGWVQIDGARDVGEVGDESVSSLEPPFEEPLPFEVKATRHPKAIEEWDEGVPPHVNAQVQWQLAVTGKPRALVAAVLLGAPPVYAWANRDGALIEELRQKGHAFWEDIREGRPPDPDGTDAAGASVRDVNGEPVDGKTIELGINAVELTEEWAQTAADRLALEKAEKALKQRIDLLVGDAQFGVLPGEKMGRWKRLEFVRAKGFVRVDDGSLMEIEKALREAGLDVKIADVPEQTVRQLRKVK